MEKYFSDKNVLQLMLFKQVFFSDEVCHFWQNPSYTKIPKTKIFSEDFISGVAMLPAGGANLYQKQSIEPKKKHRAWIFHTEIYQ